MSQGTQGTQGTHSTRKSAVFTGYTASYAWRRMRAVKVGKNYTYFL